MDNSHEALEQDLLKNNLSEEENKGVVSNQTEERLSSPSPLSPLPPLAEIEDLTISFLVWIAISDWSASSTYLQDHADLLTDSAQHVLAVLASSQTDPFAQQLLFAYQELLLAIVQQGKEAVYTILGVAQDDVASASDDVDDLKDQLITWMHLSNWKTSQAYLQTHPYLLAEDVAPILEQLIHTLPEDEKATAIIGHQQLLKQAGRWESTGVYDYLHLAKSSSTLGKRTRKTLSRLLETWCTALRWEQEQAYLEEHPDLLTPQAEALLALSWLKEHDDQKQIRLAQHLLLLQHACSDGIPLTYHHLLDAASLHKLATKAYKNYQKHGDRKKLELAIASWQQALFLVPPDSPHRRKYLEHLGYCVQHRYHHTEEREDIAWAIAIFYRVRAMTSAGSSKYLLYTYYLGTALYDYAVETGEIGYLAWAIHTFQEASIKVILPDSSDVSCYLSELGEVLRQQYHEDGDLEDLEQAIQALQQVIQFRSPDDAQLPADLVNLGNGLSERYQHTGDIQDLEQALALNRQAMEALPATSPERPLYANSLAVVLRLRYLHTGALEDLEQAITLSHQAVEMAPSEPGFLSNLGVVLLDSYQHTGAQKDLEQAIVSLQDATAITPSHHPNLPIRLNALGGALHARYLSTGSLNDLEQAIEMFQQAVEITPLNAPALPGYLTNLGTTFDDLYKQTGAS